MDFPVFHKMGLNFSETVLEPAFGREVKTKNERNSDSFLWIMEWFDEMIHSNVQTI